ncbi:MAG: hypothetical protein CMP48_13265 [Rickettsiales bacterium]|nr:hypothetical protein [Rickettsiales bacterium]
MKYSVMMIITLLVLIPNLIFGQDREELKTHRSDTIGFSVNGKYTIFLNSVGFEQPIRNFSIVGHANYNYVYKTSLHEGTTIEKGPMLELRYYFSPEFPDRHYFISLFTRYKWVEHGAPDEGVFNNSWYRSEDLDFGLLAGFKQYFETRFYIDAFVGAYFGFRDGQLRTDDPNDSSIPPTYEPQSAKTAGLVVNGTFGFHPFLKGK